MKNLKLLLAITLLFSQTVQAAGAADTSGGITIKSQDQQYSFRLHGFLQLDSDYFDGLHNNNAVGSETKLRRARLIFKGKLPDGFQYNMMTNYNNAKKSVELLNAFINYNGFQYFDIKVGRFKEPFGMEALSNAKWLASIERSFVFSKPTPVSAGLFVDAGVMLHRRKKHYTWAIGLFDDGVENNDGKDSHALTARVTWAPVLSNTQVLHLGLAVSDRNPKQGTDFKFQYPLGINSAKSHSFFATTIDGLRQNGIEIAYRNGPFSVQSELISSSADGDSVGADVDVDDNYVLFTYTITGQQRHYKYGVFGPVKGQKAFELVFKHEMLESRLAAAPTVEANINTVGFNYYINQHAKFAFNVVDVSGKNLGVVDSGDGMALRYQIGF